MTKGPKKRTRARGLLARFMLGLVLVLVLISMLPVIALRWLPPPASAFMLQYKFGQPTGQQKLHPLRYQWTAWENIAPAMRLAVVAAEDQKFPSHHGFDFASIHEALTDYYVKGDNLRGASTISQQVAKNLFLWPDKNIWRKGLEAWFTLLIELCWPKQRILEVYLNIAEFGPGIYGVQAAGLTFFNKTATMLTPADSALLAAALPNPDVYDAANPSAYMLERRRWILQQMRQLGGTEYISHMPR